MKHLVKKPHAIFSVENPKGAVLPELEWVGTKDALAHVNSLVEKPNAHQIKGVYDGNENSIFVSNPSKEQLNFIRKIAHAKGQESHIESDGVNHKMYYSHGDNAGKVALGKDTVFHTKPPENYYSTMPDGTHFTHNFDFSKYHDSKDLMKKSDKIPGGLADKKTNKDFPKDKIAQGRKVEMEHTSDPKIAEEIARDHLTEDLAYYNKLKTIEKKTLAKGLKGDWKKEGYQVKEGRSDKYYVIEAHHPQHGLVGKAHFTANKTGTKLIPVHAVVKPEHRRKGIASAMYAHAEKIHNTPISNKTSHQTTEAKALWGQPNRPFGKSLQKTNAPSAPKVNLNPEHGKALAQVHERAMHSPDHPKTKEAYSALIQETANQYKDLLKQGYKFSPIKPGQENPYKSSKDLHHDLENNKHMWYFPTEQGFGPKGSEDINHPLFADSGHKDSQGNKMTHNCVFRVVHDINGHHHGGKTTFGPKGEMQAYLTHKKMYSPKALPALAAETLLQNSAVNYGKHGEHNRKNPSETVYAEQKAFAAPDWVVNGRWHE